MKKTFVLFLTALLAVALCACGGDTDPTSTPTPAPTGAADATPTPAPVEGRSKYTFASGDIRLPMNEEFSALREALGEPLSYYEAESCAFQGLDKTFNYPGFELVTYPNGDKDFISDIYFTDGTVATPEGIRIGSTLEEVKAAYGEGYTADDFGIYYTYTDGDTQLKFGTEDGVVTEIEYVALNDLLG